LAATPTSRHAVFISSFLNAFIGSAVEVPQQSSDAPKKKPNKKNQNPLGLIEANISHQQLWARIKTDSLERFGLAVDASSISKLPRAAIARSFCTKVGLSIAARVIPLTARPFSPADILGLHSLVKHMEMSSIDAVTLMTEGKRYAAAGDYVSALNLLTQALTIFYQSSPIQTLVSETHNLLSNVMFSLGDIKNAIYHQHRALQIVLRTKGPDYFDTVRVHINMFLFAKWNSQKELAAYHVSQSLYTTRLLYHPLHPENIATITHFGILQLALGNNQKCFEALEEALELAKQIYGENHLQTASCYHTQAVMSYNSGDPRKVC
jgi:tetratricopeptide (TPR) repeat protein